MINSFLIVAAVFWFAVFVKKLLFWVYLWQLKEYHIGRFLDHFRTYLGKTLILNRLLVLKLLAILGIYVAVKMAWTDFKINLIYLAILVFFVEAVFFIRAVRRGTFKKPVLTRKTAVILSTGLSLGALILFGLFVLEFSLTKFVFSLLFFDVLAMFFFSALVLFFQPMAVVLRNRILKQAKIKRAQFEKVLVIGITGSYGKTSTKEYLAAILSEKFKVLKTREHQNSEVGIAQCVLNELDSTYQIFVVEMGAYNRGGIKLLCDIVKPKIGILTGINEQHMATFGSQENIIRAKYELIESLPQDGTAFFNGKNRYCRELYEKTLERGSVQAKLYGQGATSAYEENLAGAMAAAEYLGMSQEEIERGVEKIQFQQASRTKLGVNGINIIDSTYSANPSGIMAHLEDLKKRPGKKILIMPCLIELGRASKEVHLRIGRKIGEVCDLAIITTKDRFKEIQEGAASAPLSGATASQGAEILFLERPEKIIKKVKSFCQPGDTVLLESRVSVQVIKSLL